MRQVITLISFILTLSAYQYSYAQSVSQLIQEGDNAAAGFNNQKALQVYLDAEKADPENWEVLWRISRTYVDIAEHMPSDNSDQKEKQLAIFEKALYYADKSVQASPGHSVTYLRRAIANGKIALFKGVFSVSEVVNRVKDDCENAIKIGNGGDYIQALSHYVLGRTHSKISEKWAPARTVLGLGWADLDTGIKELKKATELYPNFRMFYFDLAKAYIENSEYSKARVALQKLMESPAKDEDDEQFLAEAKKLHKEIGEE